MASPPNPHELQRGTTAIVIARNIRNDIEAGKLTHGQQLPSTRTLAKQWGTSVATISRAMALLAEEGKVLNHARSSRIVNNPGSTTDRRNGHVGTPKVIMIGGYAGSGKSELGRILARATGWPMIDKDTITRPVVETALELLGQSPHDRESETYLTVVRPAEYNALIATMVENVECGNSAIVTAPFIREFGDQAWCERITASIESMHAELHVVWVRCDPETMSTYLKYRGAARDTVKLANWSQYLSSLDLDFRPATEHQVIDNSAESRPLQQQAAELLANVTAS